MIKKSCFLISFILIALSSFAQRDLIVTQSGEQIRCKIIEETATAFRYVYLTNEKKPLRNSVFKSLVQSFQYNYFPEDLIQLNQRKFNSNDKVKRIDMRKKDKIGEVANGISIDSLTASNQKKPDTLLNKYEFKNYLKYRVGIKTGFGANFGALANSGDYNQYLPNMKYGYVYGADALVFVNKSIGLGFTFSNFVSNASNNSIDYNDLVLNTNAKAGKLSEHSTQKFVGPTLAYRKKLNYRNFIVTSLSPGLLLYNSQGSANANIYAFEGKNLGASLNVSYDLLLGNDIVGRDVILSIEAGYLYGQIKSLNYGESIGNKTLATPMNLSRFDLSVGLRFLRFPFKLR